MTVAGLPFSGVFREQGAKINSQRRNPRRRRYRACRRTVRAARCRRSTGKTVESRAGRSCGSTDIRTK